MRYWSMASVTALLAVLPVAAAVALAIPDTQLDKSRIYYGAADNFDKPAELSIEEALQSTPEFQEIKKKKIDHGTAKYWILVSDATDRVHRAIGVVGRATDYDLIAEKGYLGHLEPPIKCDDVTAAVIDRISAE